MAGGARLTRRSLVASLLGAAAVGRGRAATLARFPYVQDVRRDRATITWTTLEPGGGVVEYSADGRYSLNVTARTKELSSSMTGLNFSYYSHKVQLTGLQSGTEYQYRILHGGEMLPAGPNLSFRTAGRSSLKFLAFGDSGQGTREQTVLARRMSEEKAGLILHTGDLVYPAGGFTEYESFFFETYADLMRQVPIFPTLGNHDYWTGNGSPYLELHAVPTDGVPEEDRGRYYSFQAGNVHFVSLDSNCPLNRGSAATNRMLRWLDQDLAKANEFWRVVYFHHPPYASGPNERDVLSANARELLVPILERHGVEVVFNGHEHSYQRTWSLKGGEVVDDGVGTVYVTTGGGGASLYGTSSRPFLVRHETVHHYLRVEAVDGRMTVRAVDSGGKEVDSFTLRPPPLVPDKSVVNSASYTASLAPGGLVSIFGRRLSVQENHANRMPLPGDLGGTTVQLNGTRLPLFYASATQINAQLPYDVIGSAKLVVSNWNGSVEIGIQVDPVAPAIFTFPVGGSDVAGIVHRSGALVSDAAPARPGEIVSMYLTGLGRVQADVAAGQPAPASVAVEAQVEVLVNGVRVTPLFAGLAPGFAGLNQIDFQLPVLPAGKHGIEVRVGAVRSNAVVIPVSAG